jgi:hypothetical protein
LPPKKHKDEFANETPREYYYRVYKAKFAGEDWAKNIPIDMSIANADRVMDQSSVGIFFNL